MADFVKFSELSSISSIDFETKFPILNNNENYTVTLSSIKDSLQLGDLSQQYKNNVDITGGTISIGTFSSTSPTLTIGGNDFQFPSLSGNVSLLSEYVANATGAHTLSAANRTLYTEFLHVSGSVITIPTNAIETIPLNSEYYFRRGQTSGSIYLSGAGVTIENSADISNIAQGQSFMLKKVGTDTWHLIGGSGGSFDTLTDGTIDGTLTINSTSISCGTGAASAFRTALGAGSPAGDAIFQAAEYTGTGSVRRLMGLDTTDSPTFAAITGTNVYAGAGTVLLPGIAFSTDTNNGLHLRGADRWQLVSGGVAMMDLHPSAYVTLKNTAIFGWANSTPDSGSAVNFSKSNTADTIDVGTGLTSNVLGSIRLTNLTASGTVTSAGLAFTGSGDTVTRDALGLGTASSPTFAVLTATNSCAAAEFAVRNVINIKPQANLGLNGWDIKMSATAPSYILEFSYRTGLGWSMRMEYNTRAVVAYALRSDTNISAIGAISSTKIDKTLAASATTLAVTNNFVKLTGDAGGNTLATITGGISGQTLVLLFVDTLVTITDTDAATADTVDLSAAFTSSARATLTLIHDGNKWFETSRSIN